MLFLVLAGLLIGSAYFYYRHEQARLHAEAVQNLQAVADFKRRQVEDWVAQKARLAGIWKRRSLISELAGRLVATGHLNSDEMAWLRERLGVVRAGLDGEAISLIDETGTLRLQTGSHPLPPNLAQRTAEAINSGDPRWIDFYWRQNPGGTEIHLDLLVPLYAHEGPAIGALLIHFEPTAFLFPVIQQWPTASATAESLLVRREGERVLYLNELRHRTGTMLQLSIPLSATEVPAVQAALGTTGVVQGKDYRGKPVQAVIAAIAGTPWKLVAKVDQREINAPLRQEALRLIVVVTGLLLSFALIARLWWRRRYLDQAARYWESETQRRLLSHRLDYLARYANDIILLIDADGRLVDVNDRAITAYGYTRDELIGLPVRELRPVPLQDAQTEQMLRSAEEAGRVYESVHCTKTGATFPVEISARRIDEDGTVFVQEIVRDISERKHAEQAVQRQAQLLALYGYTKTEAVGQVSHALLQTRFPMPLADVLAQLAAAGTWTGELRHVARDGHEVMVESRHQPRYHRTQTPGT